MSPIIPSRYGHPKYNIFPQKSRSASLGGFKATQRGTPGLDSKSRRKQRIEESKITLQPTEDEDGDNFFSKHLAAARFQRNHRLINVLFSDVVVDQEQPTDVDKLQACKKRVKSLTEYQKKIDDEIVELTDKFHAKKAKIGEDGKKFADKLQNYISTSKKELDTLRAAQEVRRQQEATMKQQQTKIDSASIPLEADNEIKQFNVPHQNVASINQHSTKVLKHSRSIDQEISLVLASIVSSVADRI